MNVPSQSSRRHDLDALRAAAMLLGIVYHAALSLALFFPWVVQDRNQNPAITWFLCAVHGFRMPLFFLISGFFTALLWRSKGLKALLWNRFRRICLPLLVGLFTIVPAVHLAIGYSFSAKGIWAAIQRGDAVTVGKQLNQGYDIAEIHPIYQVNLLTWAAIHGQSDVVQILLTFGADVKARNSDGGTALHAASFLGQSKIVDQLIDYGADVHAKNNLGQTPLHNAGIELKVVRMLVDPIGVKTDLHQVEAGRKVVVQRLREHGAEEVSSTPATSAPQLTLANLVTSLMVTPTFSLLWFLWFLGWCVVLFAIYALVADCTGWRSLPSWMMLPGGRLLWLVPVTMIPGWFMQFSGWAFGPDTSMGVLPMPHVFAYYAIFFGFGVFYFDSNDVDGRVGASWRWVLPTALLVVSPIAIECATGILGIRNEYLPRALHHIASVGFQTLYAWMMTFGCMGMFRALLRSENQAIRYLSDASYWLYLTHLPLVILMQTQVRDWDIPSFAKLAWISGSVTIVLLLAYASLVRYTWIGTFLNGKRTIAQPTANRTVTSGAASQSL